MKQANRRENLLNLLYILPMLAVFAAFIIYPIIEVFNLSVYDRTSTGQYFYVGLNNFIKFIHHRETSRLLLNTGIWVFVGTFFKLLFGLGIALVLYQAFPGKKVMTGIILIPYAMPAAVSCMIWRLMYNPVFGHIGDILTRLGLISEPLNFLGNTKTSLLAVMIVNVWAVAPFCALNILSTLYSIPTYIYEAAKIDGANSIQAFFKITLPLIASSMRTLGLLVGIWAFNSFDVIFMMTQGGPANSSSILVSNIYQNAFQFNNRPYSAAVSVVCFVILSIFALLYVRSKEGDVSYE